MCQYKVSYLDYRDLAMKASSLVDIGQEGEGDRVDNQERNPQVISIQVQGPGTSNFCFSIGIKHLEQFELKHLWLISL